MAKGGSSHASGVLALLSASAVGPARSRAIHSNPAAHRNPEAALRTSAGHLRIAVARWGFRCGESGREAGAAWAVRAGPAGARPPGARGGVSCPHVRPQSRAARRNGAHQCGTCRWSAGPARSPAAGPRRSPGGERQRTSPGQACPESAPPQSARPGHVRRRQWPAVSPEAAGGPRGRSPGPRGLR